MKIGDVLVEFKLSPVENHEYEILTLTEKNGFVRQIDRFKKRLATEDISKYKVVERNTIAFNPYLLWAGALALNDNFDDGIVSPLYPTFRVKEDVDAEYLFAILLSPQMIQQFDQISYGSVPRKRRSSVKDFLNLQLPGLPPLGEQKRIAEILGGVSKAIQQVEGQLERTQELSLSVVDNFVKNEVVDTQPLYKLVEFRGGSTPSKKNDDFWDDGNIRWFTSKDLKLNELVDSIDHVTESAIKNTALKPVSNIKAIAISLRGMSLAHRVPMSVIPANSCVNQDLKALIPKAEMDVSVIFALLKREEAYLLTKVTTSAHGTKKLDFPHVKNLQIPKLSSVQISKIKLQLEHINQLNHLLHRKLSLLQELQKSLANRAFASLL